MTNTVSPANITWTQTIVVLAAATAGNLIASNQFRKALRWMNIGTNPMTVVPGTAAASAAVVGAGMQYNGNGGAGNGGGSDTFYGETSIQPFNAISTLGTTVCVWEGT